MCISFVPTVIVSNVGGEGEGTKKRIRGFRFSSTIPDLDHQFKNTQGSRGNRLRQESTPYRCQWIPQEVEHKFVIKQLGSATSLDTK
jgi:hypothetical protein